MMYVESNGKGGLSLLLLQFWRTLYFLPPHSCNTVKRSVETPHRPHRPHRPYR